MACTPLSVGTGLFIDASSTSWSTAPNTSMGNKTVTRNANGITVTGPTGTLYHPTLGISKYFIFGSNNYVLLLEAVVNGNSVQYGVTLADFTVTPPVERSILLDAVPTSATPPNVQFSQGTGIVFMIFNSGGTEIHNLGMYRSDTGAFLFAGPEPLVATGETQGSATATQLIIHYTTSQGSHDLPFDLPSGQLDVIPNAQTFDDAVLGGAPTLATTKKTFTLKNTGNDCLLINGLTDAPPFLVTHTSTTLPASLGPNQTMTVEVTFAPSTPRSTPYTGSIPVSRTPAKGDAALACSGKARAAVASVGFTPAALAFGKVPVGNSSTKTLSIRNTGEMDLNVSLAASPAGSAFAWGAFTGVIAYGATQPLQVTFTPTADAATSASISVASNAPGSPHTVATTGTGCIANAAIVTPPAPFPGFGQVQRGFRTVRYITIQNTGDGPLSFRASIAGTDASLFGLQGDSGSITDVEPLRSYAVDPVSACGSLTTGSGEVAVAVAVFANDVPRLLDAQLVIDNHNATNTAQTSWTYPLSAEIVAGVPVDAAIVLDRSGSMNDTVGVRKKFEAAVSAGKLLAELVRPDVGDRAAVVKFNQDPGVVQGMVEVTTANQAAIVGKINPTELAPTGNTSIAAGVIVAVKEAQKPRSAPVPEVNQFLVVLTDGMDNTPYFDPDDNTWYSLAGGLSSRLWGNWPLGFPDAVATQPVQVPAGIKIYGVGIGKDEDIDKAQLDRLSETTGAYFGIVGDLAGATYFDLEKYFTQIYMNVVGTTPISDPVYTIRPGETQEIEFDVLRGDVSFLVVVYDRAGLRLPFHLLSPRSEIIDASFVPAGFQLRAGAAPEARFLDVRVPPGETDRYAGRWTLVVAHQGRVCVGDPRQRDKEQRLGFLPAKCKPSREPVDYGVAIGVGSNFRLQPYVTPNPVKVGEPILLSAVVSEAGMPACGCKVVVTATTPGGQTSQLILLDDGAHDDGDANDGEYARRFTRTSEGGTYHFVFRATGTSRDGEPVIREAARAKYVEGRVPVGPVDDPCCRGTTKPPKRPVPPSRLPRPRARKRAR